MTFPQSRPSVNSARPTDIRVFAVRTAYRDFKYRTPIKFGGQTVAEITVLEVECDVLDRRGRWAKGFGSMPLGNVWAFPSRRLGPPSTLAAMRRLAERCRRVTERLGEFGHPVELGSVLELLFLEEARAAAADLGLEEPIPKLATLVTGSAFDAAIHDAFGKVHGINCYDAYGREWFGHDLAVYLGRDYSGLSLGDFVRQRPRAFLPLSHLVGALDPLDDGDLATPVGDRWPETLRQWIHRDGIFNFKIKLNGDDAVWDLDRVLGVDRIASEVLTSLSRRNWHYSLDFNERCPDADYLVALLARVRERAPQAFARIQYVEQPTDRDLRRAPANRMHAAAQLKPVVIDESLTDLESLLLARELGYTGVALKACKGQTQSLLMAVAAQRLGMFLCVQDLTCPGASLVHSVGLAARVPGVSAVEANARQYCPAASIGWEGAHPAIFRVLGGVLGTASISGPGLGAVAAT